MRRASMCGVAYVAVLPRWLLDAEEPNLKEMLRYICAFDNVDVCKVDGCAFGCAEICPVALIIAGMPLLTMQLKIAFVEGSVRVRKNSIEVPCFLRKKYLCNCP